MNSLLAQAPNVSELEAVDREQIKRVQEVPWSPLEALQTLGV